MGWVIADIRRGLSNRQIKITIIYIEIEHLEIHIDWLI